MNCSVTGMSMGVLLSQSYRSEKPQDGIQELRFIDALKIKYVRKQKKRR